MIGRGQLTRPTTKVEKMEAKPLQVGDHAPNHALLTLDHQSVHLSETFKQGTTLLTFLRHFGCTFCRQWLSQLENRFTDLTAAGLEVVAVAMGDPKHAARYCPQLAPSATCLSDSTVEVYNVYGLKRAGLKEFASLDMLVKGARATIQGYFPGEVTADPTMLPGTFIVDNAGIVRYAYYSKHPGDHPDIDALIHAAQAVKIGT